MIKTCYVKEKGKRCGRYLTYRGLMPLQIDTHHGFCTGHGLVVAWNSATDKLTRLRHTNVEDPRAFRSLRADSQYQDEWKIDAKVDP